MQAALSLSLFGMKMCLCALGAWGFDTVVSELCFAAAVDPWVFCRKVPVSLDCWSFALQPVPSAGSPSQGMQSPGRQLVQGQSREMLRGHSSLHRKSEGRVTTGVGTGLPGAGDCAGGGRDKTSEGLHLLLLPRPSAGSRRWCHLSSWQV